VLHYLRKINLFLFLSTQVHILNFNQRLDYGLHLIIDLLFSLIHQVALSDRLREVEPFCSGWVQVIHQANARIRILDLIQPVLQLLTSF
jgi:hypothetical protein